MAADSPTQPSRPALIELAGVGKTFGRDIEALKELTLSVRQGDFLSLLGPSGCGKTTALRLIAGLLDPTRGQITWAGGQGRDDLGIVFQEPTLMPWATVAHNVWLPFRLRGQSFEAAKSRVMDALALVGLQGFAEAYPRELSGGMKMRVAIARAMVAKPRLILMDEPFAALDEITRFKLNNDLLDLKEKIDCTVIYVTHSVFESVYLSNRIAVMGARPGRVVQEVAIDAPYPRDEAFRTSAGYAALCRQTSHALHLAMGEPA